jgi:hypothetical protein
MLASLTTFDHLSRSVRMVSRKRFRGRAPGFDAELLERFLHGGVAITRDRIVQLGHDLRQRAGLRGRR